MDEEYRMFWKRVEVMFEMERIADLWPLVRALGKADKLMMMCVAVLKGQCQTENECYGLVSQQLARPVGWNDHSSIQEIGEP